MKQILITVFFFTISLTLFSQTQLDMNQTANDKYLIADKELNRVYAQILEDYQDDSNFIEKLKVSQRLWIKFRDAELEMKFPEPDKRSYYGSIFPMCASGYLEQLTIERTKKLKEWLKSIPEGECCHGSIKYRETSKKDIVIEQVENFEIIRLINDIEILTEFKTTELSVRILALGNLPGSAGFASGEITHDLFIAVSEFGEIPEQNLFRVSEMYNPQIENINTNNVSQPIIEILFGNEQRLKFELNINEIIKTSR